MANAHASCRRPRTRVLLRHAGLLAALLLAAGCRYTITERHLLHPHRFPALPDTVARSNVEGPAADGTVLRGWLLRAPGSRRALLFCLVAGADHNDLDVLRGPAAVYLGRFLDDVVPPD